METPPRAVRAAPKERCSGPALSESEIEARAVVLRQKNQKRLAAENMHQQCRCRTKWEKPPRTGHGSQIAAHQTAPCHPVPPDIVIMKRRTALMVQEETRQQVQNHQQERDGCAMKKENAALPQKKPRRA